MAIASRLIIDSDWLNARDLGGIAIASGARTRRGFLYRGGATRPSFPSGGSRKFRPATYVDLRTENEATLNAWSTFPVQADTKRVCCPIHVPKFSETLGANPEPSVYTQAYIRIAKEAATQVSDALQAIASVHWPLIFGCSLGKDRTGIISALILHHCGASPIDIANDHALSARQLRREASNLVSDRQRKGLTPQAYERRLCATSEAMIKFLEWWSSGQQATLRGQFHEPLSAICYRWVSGRTRGVDQ